MKSLMPLYSCLLIDASRWCRASTLRDFNTISERVKGEGLSFVTITLPRFCQDFEQALARSYVVSTDFQGFRKTGLLPSFLKGLTTLVFDQSSGRLLDDPDVNAIFFVRQVCLYAKKIRLPCTERRNRAAFRQYVETDNETRLASRMLTNADLSAFEAMSDKLFSDVLSKTDIFVGLGLHIPKHGPGATADRLVANRKFDLPTWPSRLERNLFPASGFRAASFSDPVYTDCPGIIESRFEPPVKVVLVPKTQKSPRIIAMEPAHIQYAQQSILEILVRELENDDLVGKMIRFTDQIPNQELARRGSINGDFATLDLKEASDRVPLRLVTRLLKPYLPLTRAIMACRSQNASVPGFGVLHLSKFASMGSALCFPVEAMVFLTLVFLGIERERGRPLTIPEIKLLRNSVRVFGDDIIIPTRYAHSVTLTLQTFGSVVNTAKSFYSGNFRESCGGEYFKGVSVKPVRLTEVLPGSRRHAEEFIATVSHRNQLYKAGLWATAQCLDAYLGKLSPFPTVSEDSSALGRHSFIRRLSEEKWDPLLQRWLVKATVVSTKKPPSPLDGFGALMKFFLQRKGVESLLSFLSPPMMDGDHLKRAGRPRSVDTRLRWVATI